MVEPLRNPLSTRNAARWVSLRNVRSCVMSRHAPEHSPFDANDPTCDIKRIEGAWREVRKPNGI